MAWIIGKGVPDTKGPIVCRTSFGVSSLRENLIVDSDASGYDIFGVRSQVVNGTEKVVV